MDRESHPLSVKNLLESNPLKTGSLLREPTIQIKQLLGSDPQIPASSFTDWEHRSALQDFSVFSAYFFFIGLPWRMQQSC